MAKYHPLQGNFSVDPRLYIDTEARVSDLAAPIFQRT
jgi:hypothetical protein